MKKILLELSVILAVIGLFYVIRAWFLLEKTPDNLLRAKAFLIRPFLHRTILLIFVVCILVALHTIFEFIDYGYSQIWHQIFELSVGDFYILTLTIPMGLLAYLAYYVFRLLSSSRF